MVPDTVKNRRMTNNVAFGVGSVVKTSSTTPCQKKSHFGKFIAFFQSQ